jgi:hypothetical protein
MLPKEGKVLPSARKDAPMEFRYPAAIAAALRGQLGDTHRAIKTVMRWTGASERTVKNWFAGTRGPSGDHLISLVHNSDAVLEAVLRMAERRSMLAAVKLTDVRDKLIEMRRSIDFILVKDVS